MPDGQSIATEGAWGVVAAALATLATWLKMRVKGSPSEPAPAAPPPADGGDPEATGGRVASHNLSPIATEASLRRLAEAQDSARNQVMLVLERDLGALGQSLIELKDMKRQQSEKLQELLDATPTAFARRNADEVLGYLQRTTSGLLQVVEDVGRRLSKLEEAVRELCRQEHE